MDKFVITGLSIIIAMLLGFVLIKHTEITKLEKDLSICTLSVQNLQLLIDKQNNALIASNQTLSEYNATLEASKQQYELKIAQIKSQTKKLSTCEESLAFIKTKLDAANDGNKTAGNKTDEK